MLYCCSIFLINVVSFKFIFLPQITEDANGVSSVVISKSSFEHTGQYEISASNSAGTAKCLAFLSVEQQLPPLPPSVPAEPPVFIRLIRDVDVVTGETAVFEAEVTGSPPPSVSSTPVPVQTSGFIESQVLNDDICMTNNISDGNLFSKNNDFLAGMINSNNHFKDQQFNFMNNDINDFSIKHTKDEILKFYDQNDSFRICDSLNEGNFDKMETFKLTLHFDDDDDNDNNLDQTLKAGPVPKNGEKVVHFKEPENLVTISNDIDAYDSSNSSNSSSDSSFNDEYKIPPNPKPKPEIKDLPILAKDVYFQIMNENLFLNYDDKFIRGKSIRNINDIDIIKSNNAIFRGYSDIDVMSSEEYSYLKEQELFHQKSVLAEKLLQEKSTEQEDKHCKIVETGIENFVQPIKLCDLWSIIKDRLPPMEQVPVNGSNEGSTPIKRSNSSNNPTFNKTDDKFNGSNENDEIDQESGYFSGSYSPASYDNHSGRASASPPEEVNESNSQTFNFKGKSSNYFEKDFININNKFESIARFESDIYQQDVSQDKSDSRKEALHLLFDDKYKDAYTSEVAFDSVKPESYLLDGEQDTLNEDSTSNDDYLVPLHRRFKSTPNLLVTPCHNNLYSFSDSNYSSVCSRALSDITEESIFSDQCESMKSSIELSNENSIETVIPASLSTNNSSNTGEKTLVANSPQLFSNDDSNAVALIPDKRVILSDTITDSKYNINSYVSDCERNVTRRRRILVKLKQLTEVLRSPSRLAISTDGTYAHIDNGSLYSSEGNTNCVQISSDYKFPTIVKVKKTESLDSFEWQIIKLEFERATKNVMIDSTSSIYSLNSDNSEWDIPADGAFIFLIRSLDNLSLTQLVSVIYEKLSKILDVSTQVLCKYVLPLRQADDTHTSKLDYIKSFLSISSKNVKQFAFETCLLAAESLGGISDRQFIDQSTPPLVRAGYFLIYVFCFDDEE